ncbi:MAG: hypothetical protein Q8N60_04355 [Candidatus Diapherotrites archaeon]|nr:hypothetical protein [Candidatus Diapherotrites archaeon]
MEILQRLFEKDKKRGLGVCIPEASKRKAMETELKENKKVKDEIVTIVETHMGNAFQVTGVFHVQDSLMLQGFVASGVISKKAKTKMQEAQLRVIDLQSGSKSPNAMVKGEHGAIFVRAEKGRFPMIKVGDMLEF